MFLISYNIGCRSCHKGDGVSHIYTVNGDNVKEFQDKSEFSVMKIIEKWHLEDNKDCPFCNSKNIEVLDIKVDNCSLYDFDRLTRQCDLFGQQILLLSINKVGNNIRMTHGGSQEFTINFHKQAINAIINTINEVEISQFEAHEVGSFFICIRGFKSVRVEKFRSSGLTKNEILKQLESQAKYHDIIITYD